MKFIWTFSFAVPYKILQDKHVFFYFQLGCKENPFDRCDAMPKSKTVQALSSTRAPAPGHGFPLIKRKVQWTPETGHINKTQWMLILFHMIDVLNTHCRTRVYFRVIISNLIGWLDANKHLVLQTFCIKCEIFLWLVCWWTGAVWPECVHQRPAGADERAGETSGGIGT